MLIGANELHLSESTIVAAVQHYFDSRVFAEGRSPRVTCVEQESNGYGSNSYFKVSVQAPEQPAEKPSGE